jgi:hypothetical protein
LTLLLVAAAVIAVVDYAWLALNSRTHPSPSIWIWAVTYGSAAAAAMGLFPAALSRLTIDPATQGSRMGMGFLVAGIAALTGPVTGGALVTRMGGSYVAAQLWAGSCLLVGMVVLTASRWVRVGWSFSERI